jgi:hypothetical protein
MPKIVENKGFFSGSSFLAALSSVLTRLTGAGAKAEATARVEARTTAAFIVSAIVFLQKCTLDDVAHLVMLE